MLSRKAEKKSIQTRRISQRSDCGIGVLRCEGLAERKQNESEVFRYWALEGRIWWQLIPSPHRRPVLRSRSFRSSTRGDVPFRLARCSILLGRVVYVLGLEILLKRSRFQVAWRNYQRTVRSPCDEVPTRSKTPARWLDLSWDGKGWGPNFKTLVPEYPSVSVRGRTSPTFLASVILSSHCVEPLRQ